MIKLSSSWQSFGITIGAIAIVAVLNYLVQNITSFGLSSAEVTIAGIIIKELITTIETDVPDSIPPAASVQ